MNLKTGDRRVWWRQRGIALASFAIAFLPVTSVLHLMVNTKGTHVFEEGPPLSELGWTLAPEWWIYILLSTILIAAATRKLDLQSPPAAWIISLCAAVGLAPILILYGVSAGTSIHVFADRYRLVAIPGIALCWAGLLSRINSRALRLLFCVALVSTSTYLYYGSRMARTHGYTWKYALQFAEKNASVDNAPVLICSDFRESDGATMPDGEAVKDNGFFAPLAYYPLSVPVIGLPRALNDEAIRAVSTFLQEPVRQRQRFLALGFGPSYQTLRYISDRALGTHSVRKLGVLDGIVVLEFSPRIQSLPDSLPDGTSR
jgi:hypothetical protein